MMFERTRDNESAAKRAQREYLNELFEGFRPVRWTRPKNYDQPNHLQARLPHNCIVSKSCSPSVEVWGR